MGHREMLSMEVDALIQQRDELHNESNKKNEEERTSHPIRVKIDEWEKEVIKQVHQAADQVRQQIEQILAGKQMSMAKPMGIFSKELALLKDSHDFVESDLTRLKQTLERFRQDLQRVTESTPLELNTKVSDGITWARLITVVDKSIQPQAQARPSSEQQWPRGRGIEIPAANKNKLPNKNPIH